MHPILFVPIYQERVWGGRALADRLGRTLPGPGPMGESWDIVDRPEAQSVDRHSGKTLRQLLEAHPEAIMGPGYHPARPFPILVKWLDCRERLSLQVHPPADVAERLGGEPKTECWYIAGAEPDAALIVGLKKAITRAAFETAVATQQLEPLLHRFAVTAGQAMLLESGRLHAIDAGNLILEIQQNSDTTYRVYDWGRVGLDGRPRQLHVENSLASIDFNDITPEPLGAVTEPGERILAQCAPFTLRQVNLAPGQTLHFAAGEQARILSVTSGRLTSPNGAELLTADNALLPYSASLHLEAAEPTTILVTEDFV